MKIFKCEFAFLAAGLAVFVPSPLLAQTPLLVQTPVSAIAPLPARAEIGVSRAECFPVESLSPALRKRAEETLLKALDGAALYTLVGAVKPMSSGFMSFSLPADGSGAAQLEEARRILRALRCGDEISAQIQAFEMRHNGKINLDGALFSHAATRAMIARTPKFWGSLAVTPLASPLEALLYTEFAPAPSRFRGYGYLFGYPHYAVDFFVESSQKQAADPEKKIVPRDFVSIPTFARETGDFTYAVPKGHPLGAIDLALRERCAPILAEYKRRRALYIGPGKRGAVELVRDWFHNGQGRYSPQFALVPGAKTK